MIVTQNQTVSTVAWSSLTASPSCACPGSPVWGALNLDRLLNHWLCSGFGQRSQDVARTANLQILRQREFYSKHHNVGCDFAVGLRPILRERAQMIRSYTRHTNQGGASGLVDEPRTRLVHHSVLVIVSRLLIIMTITILRTTEYPDRHHHHHHEKWYSPSNSSQSSACPQWTPGEVTRSQLQNHFAVMMMVKIMMMMMVMMILTLMAKNDGANLLVANQHLTAVRVCLWLR